MKAISINWSAAFLSLLLMLTISTVQARRIFEIQGARHVSPYANQCVTDTPGVVTRVVANGFFMQDEEGDNNPITSDGIFVFTSTRPEIEMGRRVTVSGRIIEFAGGSESNRATFTEFDLSQALCSTQGIKLGDKAAKLPTAVVVGSGGRIPPTEAIYSTLFPVNLVDNNPALNPTVNAKDFWKSLQGMRVQFPDVTVVGPTRSFSAGASRELSAIPDDAGAWVTSRTPRCGTLNTFDDKSPENIVIQDVAGNIPVANVCDKLRFASSAKGEYWLEGVLWFNASVQRYAFTPDAQVVADSGGLSPQTTTLVAAPDYLTVATLNVQNLLGDDPANEKYLGLAAQICSNLQKPDIIFLSEIGNNTPNSTSASNTWNRLVQAIVDTCNLRYWYVQINPRTAFSDGGISGRGIRQGFLLNRNGRVFYTTGNEGGHSDANSVLDNPLRLFYDAGRVDPTNPIFNTSTGCYSATRKPLAIQVEFNFNKVFLIGNHFPAKIEDDPLYGRNQPPINCTEVQRVPVANVVRNFTQQILNRDPSAKVIVLGDLNDYEYSPSVSLLGATYPPLLNLAQFLPIGWGYSHVTTGNAQALDHILASVGLVTNGFEFEFVHMNSEFSSLESPNRRWSDHEALVARFYLPRTP